MVEIQTWGPRVTDAAAKLERFKNNGYTETICAELHARLRDWKVDKVPRKWERPSDHAPVVVELGPAD